MEIVVVAPEAECTSRGIEFENFPKLRYRESRNFKDHLVQHYRRQRRKVVYIGDTLNDYEAIKNADLAFVVRGSDLAQKCARDPIVHREMSDFREVINGLHKESTRARTEKC